MRRALLAALAGVVLWGAAVLAAAPPAGAIETQSFGLGPAGSSGRTALHEDVRPGASVDDAVRLWNKTDAPVTVRLQVQGASLDDAGQVSLGGTEGAAGWVRLGRELVTIPPRGSVDVPVTTRAPRNMPSGTTTAAIVAQLEDAGGAGGSVSVVQRVALMVYVKAPAGSPLQAALGWAAWVAVALLVAVAGAMLLTRRHRSPRNSATPSHRFGHVSSALGRENVPKTG